MDIEPKNTMQVLQELKQSVIEGSKTAAQDLTRQALDAGIPAAEILNDALMPAMAEVGALFERKECFVPEMLLAARAMQSGVALLKPHLVGSDAEPIGKVVLGSVKGDMHDIGKNLVGMLLEGAGFQVIDLGVDVPPERFLQAVREHQPRLLGMSALLTTTMPWMAKTIQALEAQGLRQRVRIIVGGAPVTDSFAAQIGADAFGPDAASAVRVARKLVEA